MIWPKQQCAHLLMLPAYNLLALSTGCAQMLWPPLEKSSHATGTWSGRVVPVTVRDHDGREYPAAAIDIETGPRVLKGSGFEWRVDQDKDLTRLVRGRGVIDPEELGISAGAKVRVSGTLGGGRPIKSLAPEGSSGGIMEHVKVVSEARNSGLVLDIGRGMPKALTE
jgi:hypothetical protein